MALQFGINDIYYIQIMLLLGNTNTNEIFEARLVSEQQKRPVSPASSRAEKTAFITDKYVHKKYIAETSEEEAEGLNDVSLVNRCTSN